MSPDSFDDDLLDRVRDLFRLGSRVTDESTVVEVRGTAQEAVVLLRWARDPRLYGVPIPRGDTSVGFYYEDPVSSTEEWLGALDTGLAVQLDTGFVSRARRVLVGDYIELREPSWPDDQRFFVGGVGPGDGLAWCSGGIRSRSFANARDSRTWR